MASEQYGAQELTDLKYENGTLTYTRNLEIGGQGDKRWRLQRAKSEGASWTGIPTCSGLAGSRQPEPVGSAAGSGTLILGVS